MCRVSEGDALRNPRPDRASERKDRFESIYEVNFAPILGYAMRRTASADDAADVVAQTFLTAWRRLDEVPDGSQARLWLYGVARRVLANYRRGERRRAELSSRLSGELVHRYPEYSGELAAVAVVFRSLPEADRELLALAAWEGLDSAQLAAVLGCSANAARIRLHRARGKLTDAMAAARESDHRAPGWVLNGGRA
jgi:RNA polymerase sigma factor (sigma-70 family)